MALRSIDIRPFPEGDTTPGAYDYDPAAGWWVQPAPAPAAGTSCSCSASCTCGR